MGVSKNRDTPKWMACNGKPYENGMIWGKKNPIFGNTHIHVGLPVGFCFFVFWGGVDGSKCMGFSKKERREKRIRKFGNSPCFEMCF